MKLTREQVLEVLDDCIEELSGYRPITDHPRLKGMSKARSVVVELYDELERANDAAAKGDLARHTAAGMELEISELRAEVERLKAKLEKVARWLDKCADGCDALANDTRFMTVCEASRKDAKNFRATAKDIRSAYTGEST